MFLILIGLLLCYVPPKNNITDPNSFFAYGIIEFFFEAIFIYSIFL